MNTKVNYLEQVQHIDRTLLLIIGLLLTLAILSFLNKTSLETEILVKRRDKLTEFLANHEIFDRFLKEKERLYWELNKQAWMSVGDQRSGDRYIFVKLFSGIGPWGWDKDRLENQYPYASVLSDFFIEDFDYWTSAGERTLKRKFASGNADSWGDMHFRLKTIIKSDTTISDFFADLLENKVTFLKTMLAKYSTTVSSELLEQIPDSIYVLRGDYPKNFVNFFNDSVRTTFYLITAFYGDLLDFAN